MFEATPLRGFIQQFCCRFVRTKPVLLVNKILISRQYSFVNKMAFCGNPQVPTYMDRQKIPRTRDGRRQKCPYNRESRGPTIVLLYFCIPVFVFREKWDNSQGQVSLYKSWVWHPDFSLVSGFGANTSLFSNLQFLDTSTVCKYEGQQSPFTK